MADTAQPSTTEQPAFLARWLGACVVAVAAGAWVGILVWAPPFNPQEMIRSDGCGYHVWTYAILKGDLTFGWFEGDPEHESLHQPDPNVRRFTCKYPPGIALVRLPVMVWFVDTSRNGPPYSVAENRLCQILGALALVGVAVLGLLTCRELGLSPWWSQFAVLMLTFGTGLFHYATYDAGFSHVYSALGVAWLIRHGVRASRLDGSASPISVLLVAMLLILIRSTNAVLIAAWMASFGVYFWRDSRRLACVLAAGIGTVFGLTILLGLNHYMFGRFTLNSYPGEEFVWDRPMMFSVLFSKKQGLVPYYPVLPVVVLIGLIARPSRIAALGLGLLILVFAALYGYWWSWYLGISFGHRGFVELVPFAVPVLATALTHLAGRWPWVTRGIAVGCFSLAVVTVCYMIGYWICWLPPTISGERPA